MKKIKFLLPIMFILGLLTSCNEDDSIREGSIPSVNAKIKLVTLSKNGRDLMKNGTEYTGKFLSFDTYEDFENTYNQLETAMEANDAYISRVIGTVNDEDELDAKFIQYNLDEFKPLKDFENLYGLNSLRKDIYDRETLWLESQGDEFDDNDPDNHYIFDTVLRTLLNKDGEVMIAGKIIRNEDWGKIEIENMDENAYYQKYPCDYNGSNTNVEIEHFDKVNPCGFNPQAEGGGSTGGGNNGSYCKISSSYEKQFNTSTRRKMKIQAKLQRSALLRNNRFIARTRYFKKVLGVWLRKKADLYVKIEGVYGYGNECNSQNFPINISNTSYSGSVEVKFVNPMPNGAQNDLSIRNNALYSTHKLWGGNTKIMDFYDGQLQ